ncbi:LysR family transcriptional regulator [Tatumella sp. UCD-D_suzukii]|uniref:LysR family transcriptional regulator n=1 Tax=Tatumella sp. UCD-D_suzukii TaxID=1408192 RepID=UPI000471D7E8|nr:LysR family transcriptional regulator [Tatumella sp. UCD-D_suzukii]
MNTRILSETAVLYFIQVVNCGSISEAATRMHVVPSAVSRQIRRLENALETALFERQARGVTLTPAGELLAAYARRTLLDAVQVTNEIQSLRQVSESKIKIACTHGFASHFMPAGIAGFRERRPDCTFQLQVAPAREVTRRVREGEADIGFSFSLGATRDIKVLYSQPAPLLALVSPVHTLAQRPEVTLRDLAEFPLALPGINTTLRQLLDIYCSRQGLSYHSVLDSDNLDTLAQFAVTGSAVTFGGELFVRHHLSAGKLIALNVPELKENDRSIEIQALASRHVSPVTEQFIDYIREAIVPPLR